MLQQVHTNVADLTSIQTLYCADIQPLFLGVFLRPRAPPHPPLAAVMVLSRLVLRAQYTQKHLVGVALCLTGLALTIISDLEGDEEEAAYPHALYGDLLCIFGAALYAGSNVMQEDFVKNHDRVRTHVRMRVVLRRTLHTPFAAACSGDFFFFFFFSYASYGCV